MLTPLAKLGRPAAALAVGAILVLSSVGSATTSASTIGPVARQTGAAPVPGLLQPNGQTWTPEGLEDLLAPVALYPDEFIGHVLVAATNPQEVLDAGNWRTKNQNLNASTLDAAARQAGFTPPVRMILQNPIVLDMLCSEFGWTQELGQAFVNDQEGVLGAIQRLRFQARNAGNLQSSDQMLVETVNEGGQEAIALTSPDPNVVHVPQYDVERVYTKMDEDDDDGISTGTAVLTSLLAFGGGLALGTLFDDDDDDDWDDDDYYYPNYYGPPMPYYAHHPYQPVYPGYYPATVYAPPPAYPYAYGSQTTVVNRERNTYWNRYDDTAYVPRRARPVASPITKARPNRPELRELNAKARRGPVRRAPAVSEERGAYKVRKLETAERAERRRAAKAQRPVRTGNLPRTPVTGEGGTPTVKGAGVPARGRDPYRARGRERAAEVGGAGAGTGGARARPKAGGVDSPEAGVGKPATTRAGRGNRAAARAGASGTTTRAGRNRAAPGADGTKSATPKGGGARKRSGATAAGGTGGGAAQKAGGGATQKAGGGGQRRGAARRGATKTVKPGTREEAAPATRP